MKIVMVEYFLPDSIYSLELCEKLSVSHEVVLICKDSYKPDRSFGFEILPILHSSSENPAQAFYLYQKDLKRIFAQIKRIKPDVFHLQGVRHFFWETRLLKKIKKTGCKCFFTAHNILSHESRRGEKEALNKWYGHFDGIIVHNQTSRKMLREASDNDVPVFVVPHGAYGTYKDNIRSKSKHTDKTVFLQSELSANIKALIYF